MVPGAGGGLEFSEAKDFADSIQMIQVKEEGDAEEQQDTDMHEDEKPAAPTPIPQQLPPPPAQDPQPRYVMQT